MVQGHSQVMRKTRHPGRRGECSVPAGMTVHQQQTVACRVQYVLWLRVQYVPTTWHVLSLVAMHVLIYCLQGVCISLLSPFETFHICCCASQLVTIVLFFPHKTLLCVAVSKHLSWGDG